MKAKILVVDDDTQHRFMLSKALNTFGHQGEIANSAEDAIKKVRYEYFDIVLTDLKMPDMNGIELLKSLLLHDPSIAVIIMTGHGSVETAVDAMKKGAEDYILKPIDLDGLEILLKKVLKKRRLVKENKHLQSEINQLRKNLGIRYHFTHSLGTSPATQVLLHDIKTHLSTRSPVLITGEFGSGRKEIARMIHFNGPWAANSLIEVDVSEVPPDLQEEQFFGSQTPVPHPGIVEKAHMCTLLLENIQDLQEKTQARLVRAIKTETSQRIGGGDPIASSFRLIAVSSNEEFEQMGVSQTLREDLHQMMSLSKLEVPPLRERREDLPLLTVVIAKKFAGALGKEVEKVEPEVIQYLAKQKYPSNILDLERMIEKAVRRLNGSTLTADLFR